MERYCLTCESPQRAVAPTGGGGGGGGEGEGEEEEDQLTIPSEFVIYFRKMGIKYDRPSDM
jgi:hypothetical protein